MNSHGVMSKHRSNEALRLMENRLETQGYICLEIRDRMTTKKTEEMQAHLTEHVKQESLFEKTIDRLDPLENKRIDCVSQAKPAGVFPSTREVTFVDGLCEKAKKVAETLPQLNPYTFPWMYLNSLVVHESAHFTDLFSRGGYPLSYIFQQVFWFLTAQIAKDRARALHHYYPVPRNDEVKLETLVMQNELSRLWFEARAMLKQKEFLDKRSSSLDAKKLSECLSWMEDSEKPCDRLGKCAYHTLAWIIIKFIEERFGSPKVFEVIDRFIRRKFIVYNTHRFTEHSGLGNTDLIPFVFLAMTDNDIHRWKVKSWDENFIDVLLESYSFLDSQELIGDWTQDLYRQLDRDAKRFLVPLISGKLHDSLMSIISMSGNGNSGSYVHQTYKVYCNELKWNSLDPEGKRLCLDLFNLRLNALKTIRWEVVRHCSQKKKCPIMDFLLNGDQRHLSELIQAFGIRMRAPNSQILDAWSKRYSDIPSRLENYYLENKGYYASTQIPQ